MPVQNYRNDLIKGAMAEKDINKERLRELTGLSTDTLRRIRQGEVNITLSNLMAVADALGLKMQELFTPKPEAETVGA
ncbi:MAG TPA: helix-turn-helix transcriptional regulator [Pyrinomonadaceae bacterium]|jgi:DNA-binding Xre family transcriptional regulator